MSKLVIFVISILIMLNFIGIASAVSDYYLESEHPIHFDHSNDWSYTREWKIPLRDGAEHIKIHFVKWSLSENDRVTILDNEGNQISRNSNGANGEDFWTPWFTSQDYITLKLTSKGGEAYGFKIDQIDTDSESYDEYMAETPLQNIKSSSSTTDDSTDDDDSANNDDDSANNDDSDQSKIYMTPQPAQEAPKALVVTHASSSEPPKLTAAGKRAVQTGRIKMPANVQPAVKNPPTVTSTLYTQDTNANVGQSIPVSYTVTNKITKPVMHVQMILEPPSGMSVDSVQNAEGQGGQFTSVVDIAPGKSNTISARLTPNNAGTFTVRGNATLYYGNDMTTQEQNDIATDIQVTPVAPPVSEQSKNTPSPTPSTDEMTSMLGLVVVSLLAILLLYIGFLSITKRAHWLQP